jgi:hypothetical protein
MKTLLTILALAACSLVAQAQTTTNLIFRVQEQHVTAGVSNVVDTANFTWDYATKKDALKIDGFRFGAAGSALPFVNWIKQDINDRAKAYSDVKVAQDNAVIAAKITQLLTTDSDLLSNAQKTQLSNIAALLP